MRVIAKSFKRSQGISKIFLAIIFILIFAKDAYAYLDLGTIGYFFQMAAAGVIVTLLGIKQYWKRFKSFIKQRLAKEDTGGNR